MLGVGRSQNRPLSEYGRTDSNPLAPALVPLFLLFALNLFSPTSLPAQSTDRSRDNSLQEARAYVLAKRYDDALVIFRRLAELNPHDLEARNWVARLESWTGHYDTAEWHYREVLAEDATNVEASLGLADVLAWQKRYFEAMEILRGLASRFPRDKEVLLRLGRFSRWQRHRKEALYYYRQVLASDPANTEARDGLRVLTEQKPFRVETGYYLEAFNFANSTNGTFVEFLYQDYDRKTFLGRFQYQNKFGENDTRFSLGATYRFWNRTWVRGEASVAPRSQTVVPNEDYTAELTQGLYRGVAAGFAYRFLSFRVADVHVPTALLNWDLQPRFHLYVRYTPSRTTFQLPARTVWNQGGWSRLVWDVNRFFSPYFLFAVGAENFATLSKEQLGVFVAHTYGIGTEVRFASGQGIRIGYYNQNRTQGHREQSFGISYFFSF